MVFIEAKKQHLRYFEFYYIGEIKSLPVILFTFVNSNLKIFRNLYFLCFMIVLLSMYLHNFNKILQLCTRIKLNAANTINDHVICKY